jgi:hypothetical protein
MTHPRRADVLLTRFLLSRGQLNSDDPFGSAKLRKILINDWAYDGDWDFCDRLATRWEEYENGVRDVCWTLDKWNKGGVTTWLR